MFQLIHEALWRRPIYFWVGSLPFLIAVTRGLPYLVGFFVFFLLEIFSDALMVGGWTPLTGAHPILIRWIPIVYVVLGDLRYFLLLFRFGWERNKGYVLPAVMSLVVPIVSALVIEIGCGKLDARFTFLAYELLFLIFLASLSFSLFRKRLCDFGVEPDTNAWLRKLTLFEGVQYAAWSVADILILVGCDVGYGIRIIPDAMYYVGFLPLAFLTAPRRLFVFVPPGAIR